MRFKGSGKAGGKGVGHEDEEGKVDGVGKTWDPGSPPGTAAVSAGQFGSGLPLG